MRTAEPWTAIILFLIQGECYNIEGDCYGLIISNVFDKEESAKKFCKAYTDLEREGGKQDKSRIKDLLKYLGIKNIREEENLTKEVRFILTVNPGLKV